MSTTLAVLLGTVADKSFTPAQLLQRAETMADTEYAAASETRAYLLTQLSKLWGELGSNDRALELAREAQASAQAGQNAHLRTEADCMLGAMLADRGEFASAIKLFNEAITSTRQQRPQEPDLTVGCLQKRAVLHFEQGRPQDALDDAQAALLALGAPRPGQMDMALMLRGIKADALSRLGRLGPAVAEYEAVLGEVRRLGRARTPRRPSGSGTGRGAQPPPHFEQALGNAQRTGARRMIASVALSAGVGACDLGDLPRGDAPASLASAQQAVQLARTAFADFVTSAPLGRTLLMLGQAERATGRADAARRSGLGAQMQLDAAAGADAPLAVQARQWLATF